MMLARSFLAWLGGFRRVRRFADAQLLAAAAAAGGSVYRAHGLAYVLRSRGTAIRGTLGSPTSSMTTGSVLNGKGSVPSELLDHVDADRPRAVG